MGEEGVLRLPRFPIHSSENGHLLCCVVPLCQILMAQTSWYCASFVMGAYSISPFPHSDRQRQTPQSFHPLLMVTRTTTPTLFKHVQSEMEKGGIKPRYPYFVFYVQCICACTVHGCKVFSDNLSGVAVC